MEGIISAIIGVICIVIGISNRKGNLSALHSYHIKRVSEQDKLPLGKKVGLGMIIVGVSLIAMGSLMVLAKILSQEILVHIGMAVLGVGLFVGLGIALLAIIKYNKGLF